MPTNIAALKSVTRDVGPLSLRASFKPGSVDEKKRTVELVWTTGARVLRGVWDKFYEELSLDPAHVRMQRLQSGKAPLLDSHDAYSVASIKGVVENARLEAGQGVATVRFPLAEDDPEADQIFRKVKDGIIANVSVGYRIFRMEQVEVSADKVPVMRATDWEPYELSLVAAGADAGAGTRSELAGMNPCEFITRSEESTMPTELKKTTTTEQPKTEPPAPAPAPVVDEAKRSEETKAVETKAREEATKAERDRIEGIRALGTKFKLEGKFVDEQIAGSKSLREVREMVLEQLAAKSDAETERSHPSVELGDDDRTKFLRAAEASIYQRAMVAEMIESAKKRATPGTVIATALGGVSLDAGPFRSMDFVDLAREFLERSGVKTRGMDKMAIMGAALTHRSGGMATASDFAVLLANVTNKTLLAAYATAPDTWRNFCGVRSVSDFRDHNLYRTGSFGTLDAVNESGEFKQKAIPDGEKAVISASSYGNIIAITRKALVNDDLGAFNDLAVKLGRAAALTIESAVYALLAENGGLGPTQTDSSPFFDSSARANVGTGAALSAAAIDADAALLASQKDPSNNEFLNLQPFALLVPRTLKGEANLINDAQFDPDANYKVQRPNTCKGMFSRVVATPRLTGTRRFMFADPALYPAIVVAFLQGQEAPTVQSQQGWRVDGTEMKVALDFGVCDVDFRAAVTNAGTASPG